MRSSCLRQNGYGVCEQRPRPSNSMAPRNEFVGPDAKVRAGKARTNSALIKVPSFWLIKTGQVKFRVRSAVGAGRCCPEGRQ